MNKPQDIVSKLTKRAPDSHKGTYGTLLTVCGSYGMAGAAMLSAKAALRSGAGLVACATPHAAYRVIGAAVPEAVFVPLRETAEGTLTATAAQEVRAWHKKATALLVGCGLGRGDAVEAAVLALSQEGRCPVVWDADGINALSLHMLSRETDAPAWVLTPHPAEMARLLHCSVDEVQRDREAAAREAAARFRAVAVLKGHRTVVADPHGTVYVNDTGNAGMATAGSGDVLAGVIGGLLAQGVSPADAAVAGVWLHGAAGDRMTKRLSQPSLIASDLLDGLAELFRDFTE